jgi:hypothetical protein
MFVGFSLIFLLGILIFKGLTARRLYKSFGVKGLTCIRLNFGCSHNSPPYVTRLHTTALKCHFPYFLVDVRASCFLTSFVTVFCIPTGTVGVYCAKEKY